MAEAVLDSSAVLAVLRGEPGAGWVAPRLATCVVSAVNYTEIISRLIDFGSAPDDAVLSARELNMQVYALDAQGAADAGALRAFIKSRGLSLGDRACLALGKRLALPVYTADRVWAELDLGVEVVLIR